MKTILPFIVLTAATLTMSAQSKQDSINKLKQEITEKQIALKKLQKNTTDIVDNENVVDKIIDDLYQMKLITSKEKVSFSLSNDKMEVNNKKQPDDIFQKFKTKYSISKGTSIACGKNINNSSTSIITSN